MPRLKSNYSIVNARDVCLQSIILMFFVEDFVPNTKVCETFMILRSNNVVSDAWSPKVKAIFHETRNLIRIKFYIMACSHDPINRIRFSSWCMWFNYESNNYSICENLRITDTILQYVNHMHQEENRIRLIEMCEQAINITTLSCTTREKNRQLFLLAFLSAKNLSSCLYIDRSLKTI